MGYQKQPGHDNRQYFILRPEKIGWLHLLSLLIYRRNLTSYKFVETDSVDDGIPTDIITLLVTFITKILSAISKPLKWIGIILEFLFNLVELNGGILGLIVRIFKVSVVIPKRDAANFRTMIGLIDGRVDLQQSDSLVHCYPFMENQSSINLLDLTMMAAKIAYENEAYIKNVVVNSWKMNFVGFYSCWNKSLNDHTTQAFIFCNKATDADLIIVSFRGTEAFNAIDWSTDVNLSWIFANKLGNLHVGFLQALGLQDDKNFILGFPTNFNSTPDKPIAYYTIREQLRSLLAVHKNAKIVVTGHSLGGALACIFPALLSYHNQYDLLGSIYGVYTFGQPRVGDAIFATYLKTMVQYKYYRIVYRFDIVPRVPFDAPPVALFKHTGSCLYYKSWYEAEIVDEAPNSNYFDPLYTLPMYFNAWLDLFRGVFAGWTLGKDYKESLASILFRSVGLIIPGVASHSPRDYVNAGRLKKIKEKSMV